MEELQLKIHDWLKGQGYSLEMQVANILHKAGFDVQQSDYYYDEDGDVYRELDVFAKLYKDTDNVHYAINFLIECKVCKSHPWVIFKRNNSGGKYKLMMFPGNKLGERMAGLYTFNKKVEALQYICKHKALGYSAVETLRTNDKKDNSYSSLMSISKALSAYSQHPKYTHAGGRKICEIFLPVLVILGDLFEAELDESSNILLSKVNNSAILWSNPACGNRATIVNIVTIDELPKFASATKKSCKILLDTVVAEGKIEKESVKTKRKVPPKQKSTAS